MCSDYILLQTFLALKGKEYERSDDISSLLQKEITIADLRSKAIREGKTNLIKQYISIEWGGNSKREDEAFDIKLMIKDYLMVIEDRDVFVEIYNYFQEKIQNPGDILYFLNPLRFPKYEIDAINVMHIDSKLNYSGFISACKVKAIDNSVLQSFIQRLSH